MESRHRGCVFVCIHTCASSGYLPSSFCMCTRSLITATHTHTHSSPLPPPSSPRLVLQGVWLLQSPPSPVRRCRHGITRRTTPRPPPAPTALTPITTPLTTPSLTLVSPHLPFPSHSLPPYLFLPPSLSLPSFPSCYLPPLSSLSRPPSLPPTPYRVCGSCEPSYDLLPQQSPPNTLHDSRVQECSLQVRATVQTPMVLSALYIHYCLCDIV